MLRILCLAGLLCMLFSCSENQTATVEKGSPFYQLVDPAETGVYFRNTLKEDRLTNTLTFEGFAAGQGVGIIDVNQDDLPDLYFCSAQNPDRLFLNQGNFKFKDISSTAGIGIEKTWSNGVSIADVNGDGFDDIYVCKGLYDQEEYRGNLLYINQGNGYFKETAKSFGIADNGYTIAANFLDIDQDGDLDLYVANQPSNSLYMKQQMGEKVDYRYTDHLYRNDGDRFTDITTEAGITNFGYALSVCAVDFNRDGWTDIYVANDYEEPDFLYINQKDGTFKNEIHTQLRHLSNFAMGSDFADVNADGWLDLFIADMAAEDNYRNKTNMSGMNPEKFWNLANHGYHFQYMFNTLQLNNGNGTFSEIAQMAGISNTDWSWSPLFMDVNLDGNQDLFVSNGQWKETRNKDFDHEKNVLIEEYKKEGMDAYDILLKITKIIPQQKLKNYIYENNGDLTFAKRTDEWGLDSLTWTHGVAYADLDRDGDLDLIMNNTDQESYIYRNTAREQLAGNYISVKLVGPNKNSRGFQSKVTARVGDKIHYNEMSPYRGYMSSSEPVVHFGLGDATIIDELVIEWTDGTQTTMQNVKANRNLVVDYNKADRKKAPQSVKEAPLLVQEASTIGHRENVFDDYEREILLPHKMSTLGPALAKADLNSDGLDDLFIGGAAGVAGKLMYQEIDGGFVSINENIFSSDASTEDVDAIFFDTDDDGDLDLYVVSGGNEYPKKDRNYQDRLYINDGNGKFSKGNLPEIRESGGVVTPLDFDRDGDLDVFVGGRQVPGFYGLPASSYLLENNKGSFSDVTNEKGRAFLSMGMVTDAVWGNFDENEDNELLVVGEWMPLQMFRFQNEGFTLIDDIDAFDHTSGWWNCVKADDIDQDGDLDLVAGNLGLNLKFKASEEKPFKVYVNDFDENGTHDIYLAYYDLDGNLFPVRGRQCSSEQMPFVKEKFESYNAFGAATVEDILEGRMEGAVERSVEMFESTIFVNQGKFKFDARPMPNEAQIAPIQDIVILDVNKDGHKDLVTVGNYYNREVETTRSDAGIGCLLLGSENGQFDALHPTKSGMKSFLDAREAVEIKTQEGDKILVVNNNAPAEIYQIGDDAMMQ